MLEKSGLATASFLGLRDQPRKVCFDPDDGYVDTPVIWRTDLGAGDTFTGPAIVEEFGSTIPVHPGFEVVVDDWANLVIRKVVS